MPYKGNEETSQDEHRALVALSMVSGIGPGRIRQLIGHMGSVHSVIEASVGALESLKGIGESAARAIVAFDEYGAVDEQFRWAERAEATLVPYWDIRFPALLDKIYDPPAFLWVRGDISALSEKAIAVVGTRKPTAYGARAADYFASALVERGFNIVSGLALGIDGVAHRAALDAQGKSVAILGSGIDRIYPAKHAGLARDLMMQGAVVSELPLRSRPDATNFPKRNRIISGLTLGTLVVEAYEKGGALITARLALEQNREVFAVPGSVFNKAATGCHAIIKEGQAKLVHRVEDVLAELGEFTEPMDESISEKNKPAVDLTTLGSVERVLYEALSDEPRHIDLVCRTTGLDISTVLVYLLSLEFKGLVFQLAGKQFYRV